MPPEPLDQQIASLRRELELRWEAHVREHVVHEHSHNREHEMTTQALIKAEVSMDKRLEGMNEFRTQLREQASTFWTRKEQDQHEANKGTVTDALDKRLDVLEVARAVDLAERETARDTLTKRMWLIGVGVGLVTFAVNILVRLAGL